MRYWDDSWNPVVGCSPISPACDRCYASREAHKFEGLVITHPKVAEKYAGTTECVDVRARFNGTVKVAAADSELWTKPLHWRKPRTVFVCNMGDLFHENVPEDAVNRVLDVVQAAPQHLFLLCTKRPEIAFRYVQTRNFTNSWIGVTVENDEWAAKRLPVLRKLSRYFAGSFVSYEPALGPVDWERHDFVPNWIVAGGESGRGARPCDPEWFRATRDSCEDVGVWFTFKQWSDTQGVAKHRGAPELDGKVHDWVPRPSEE